MEANRAYEAEELHALFPDSSMDGLREIMHELWVARCVERFGHTGWKRQVSTCASKYAPDPRSCASCPIARSCARAVKQTPSDVLHVEQWSDHPAFAGLFK